MSKKRNEEKDRQFSQIFHRPTQNFPLHSTKKYEQLNVMKLTSHNIFIIWRLLLDSLTHHRVIVIKPYQHIT